MLKVVILEIILLLILLSSLHFLVFYGKKDIMKNKLGKGHTKNNTCVMTSSSTFRSSIVLGKEK